MERPAHLGPRYRDQPLDHRADQRVIHLRLHFGRAGHGGNGTFVRHSVVQRMDVVERAFGKTVGKRFVAILFDHI